ncbi:mitochondrial matrix iron-sulfur protein [Gnomoniopsis sp. IMI 355080]|nr:mitochondrial matrix iron-sulfur protein [Gnomoniopsis sp. IMI 355080]
MATPRTLLRSLTRSRVSTLRIASHFAPSSRPYSAVAFSIASRSSLKTPRPTAARCFSSTPTTRHGHIDPPKPGEELYVTFIDKDGQEIKVAVNKGDNLLDVAQAHDIEMEGACGGSCACSTCHVIIRDEDFYEKIPEPDDDENDMLDLAFGLTETSRLGCQVTMTPELDGLVVKLPSMTRNLQASDFKS